MSGVNVVAGLLIVIIGAGLFTVEIFHPGALLLIPGSIVLVAGFLYLFAPNDLLDSYIGPVAIVIAAILGALIEIPYYRWVAPVHRPLSTTSAGLVGDEAVVITAVEPETLKGKVRIRSETWSARASQPIPAGTRVRVIHGEGVSLTVEPIETPAAK